MKKQVNQTIDGVKIYFSGEDVKKDNIVQMMQNCQQGQCDCMSDDTKSKIKDMKINGNDGDMSLEIIGDIRKQEIQDALNKSKVINTN